MVPETEDVGVGGVRGGDHGVLWAFGDGAVHEEETFVLLSKNQQIGEAQFEQTKKAFKGKILPGIHPESIRVRVIARDIIGALQRGLRKDKMWSDLKYAVDSDETLDDATGLETLLALSEGIEKKWRKDDEIFYDKWVEESRKRAKKRWDGSDVGHLEGMKWEVLVVKEPVVNAFCLPGGKIVVFTGLLEHFRTNADIATVIGHEDGNGGRLHWASVNDFSWV